MEDNGDGAIDAAARKPQAFRNERRWIPDWAQGRETVFIASSQHSSETEPDTESYAKRCIWGDGSAKKLQLSKFRTFSIVRRNCLFSRLGASLFEMGTRDGIFTRCMLSTLIMTIPLIVVPAIALLRPPAPGGTAVTGSVEAGTESDDLDLEGFENELNGEFGTSADDSAEETNSAAKKGRSRDGDDEWSELFPEDSPRDSKKNEGTAKRSNSRSPGMKELEQAFGEEFRVVRRRPVLLRSSRRTKLKQQAQAKVLKELQVRHRMPGQLRLHSIRERLMHHRLLPDHRSPKILVKPMSSFLNSTVLASANASGLRRVTPNCMGLPHFSNWKIPNFLFDLKPLGILEQLRFVMFLIRFGTGRTRGRHPAPGRINP